MSRFDRCRGFVPLWSFVAVALAASYGAGVAHATLYRWVDAQGQVHFGDQPHPGAQTFNPRVMPATSASAPTTAVPASAKRASDCADLEARLDRYRKASSITETDALGNSHTLTTAERDELLARTQVRVGRTCGDAGSTPAPD